ncbi:hypothetical protein F2Q69_00042195 [Brassica cretica]|uniref:Uncharacterized protein n=1 Tax=Brassica cretica TaxID=69181 RepID=A0A8S9NCE3_BRACR|nr:hypothetical protein F2Q69_00042195 [Brassica cretica]
MLSSSIGYSPSFEGVLTASGGYSDCLGLGLSALSHATSIFGTCTRSVIGARQSIGARGCRSMAASLCRSMEDSPCRSMEVSARRVILTLSGLGGCVCFAANSS